MNWIVPVAKAAECPPGDQEHWDRIQVVFDEFGVVESICPEHGPVMRIESVEFDTEEEALEYIALEYIATRKAGHPTLND